jgi:hypothetical protein
MTRLFRSLLIASYGIWPALLTASLALLPALLSAQLLDPALLAKPATDAWPTYKAITQVAVSAPSLKSTRRT